MLKMDSTDVKDSKERKKFIRENVRRLSEHLSSVNVNDFDKHLKTGERHFMAELLIDKTTHKEQAMIHYNHVYLLTLHSKTGIKVLKWLEDVRIHDACQ